jgi:GTP-binding protein HflX
MRCFVICPSSSSKVAKGERTSKSKSDEFVALSAALKTVNILEISLLNLTKTKAGTFFGTGKISEFISVIEKYDIQLVLIDAQLSPMQQRNLERAFKAKVIDRTGLILEIFGDRAQTSEGALQVELAHLEYQKSRLVRSWTHLERQRGGVGFLGGPGETQIESDRRAIANKIFRIKKSFKQDVCIAKAEKKMTCR